MNEEKFISIEYETWKNKYLPLEEENKRLRREINEVRESKKYKLVFDLRRMPSAHLRPHSRSYYGEFEVGIVTMIEGFGNVFSLEAHHTDILKHYLNEVDVHMIVSEEKARELARDILEKTRLLNEEQNKLIKKRVENEQAIKHIPKFIKWIFRIK